MPTQKIDPKVIFASDAPAIDKPPVFSDKTKGWDVARANDGRPQIKEMNKIQQDTDLKILWLNENAVLPYDASIDYPDGAVTLKDGSFKQLSDGSWVEFLDDFADKDAVKRGIANRYDSSLTYNSGERVVLANGDIVKSTVNGNTNDPNVDMTGWVKTNSASQIFDESGLSQQEINNLFSSQGVNILSVYGGIDDFGVALELAWAKAKAIGVNTIYIPSKNYELTTTANISLDRPLKLDFSNNVTVWAKQSVDAINVTMGSQYLLIEGNGATFYPAWDVTLNQPALLKLDSRTLSKSAKITDINCLARDGLRFQNGINSSGLNYSLIEDCLFQAVDPIVNASSPTNDGHSMGTVVRNCFLHGLDQVGTALTLVNNGSLACEGWVFDGGEWFGTTGLKVINNLTSSGYLSPLLNASNVHMNCTQFAKLDGVGRVQFTGCDLQSQIESNNPHTGLFELTAVQSFVLGAGTTISQAPTTGNSPADSLPVLSFRDSPRGAVSAFAKIDGANLWLHQNAPLVVFQSNECYAGRVEVGYIDPDSFTGPIALEGYRYRVSASSNSKISNISTGTGVGLSDAVLFDSTTGVLTLKNSPIVGDVYQAYPSVVPAGSTINRIDAPSSIGKNYKVIFEASDISFIHSSTLYTPSQQKLTILYGGTLDCFSYNSNICRILDVSSHTSVLPVSSVPINTSTSGANGQKIFSGGFVYEYIVGTGWVRYAASTF